MKTHYAEESDDVISSNDTADDHCWREHKVKRTNLVSDLSILAAVLTGLLLVGYAWNAPPALQDGNVVHAYQPSATHFAGDLRRPARQLSEADDDR
jgi:hypothetical protein